MLLNTSLGSRGRGSLSEKMFVLNACSITIKSIIAFFVKAVQIVICRPKNFHYKWCFIFIYYI